MPQEPKLEGEEGIPHHDEHDKAMAGRSMELDLYFSDMDGRLLRADTRADEVRARLWRTSTISTDNAIGHGCMLSRGLRIETY